MQQMLKDEHENSPTLHLPLLTDWGRMGLSSKSLTHDVLSCIVSICVGLFSQTYLLHTYFNFWINTL